VEILFFFAQKKIVTLKDSLLKTARSAPNDKLIQGPFVHSGFVPGEFITVFPLTH
jgi:hypothetical protein